MNKWTLFLSAVCFMSLAACFSSAQDDVLQNATLKQLLAKPKAIKLTQTQRRNLVPRSAGGFANTSQIVTLSPRTMVIPNRASMLVHLCGLFWPAADAAYFDRQEGYRPEIQYRIKVDAGVKFVIVSTGIRTDGMGEKNWNITFRRQNASGATQSHKTKTATSTALASVVFAPSAAGWYEGRLTPESDGPFCLDFLEFTLVR